MNISHTLNRKEVGEERRSGEEGEEERGRRGDEERGGRGEDERGRREMGRGREKYQRKYGNQCGKKMMKVRK